MPVLAWLAISGLVGWIGGSVVTNKTDTPTVVVSPPETSAASGMSTTTKVVLYAAAGLAAVYLGKKLIAKI